MSYQGEKDLEKSSETLEDLLANIPQEEREELLEDLENVSPGEALDLLIHQFDQSVVSLPSESLETQADVEEVSEPGHENFAPGVLSEEERSFFFDSKISSDEVVAVSDFSDDEQGTLVVPVVQDTKRLLYFNLVGLCTLLCLMTVIAWLLVESNRKNQGNFEFLKNFSSSSDRQWLLSLPETEPEEQIRILENRLLDSNLKKEEKIFIFYLLSSLSFRQGDYAKGKDFIVRSLKLEGKE